MADDVSAYTSLEATFGKADMALYLQWPESRDPASGTQQQEPLRTQTPAAILAS